MKNKLIKILCPFLALAVCLSVFSLIAFGDDTDINGTYKYTSDTDTLEIFSDDIMIDRTEADFSKNPWFSYKSSIKHIVIHNGVTKISDLAFSRMDNLLDVQIPDTVVSIGNSAFAGNDNLNKLEISDNVTSIGDYAFGLNSKMLVKSDFECVCSSVSFAQSWCLKNYIPFTTEFVGNSQTVNINANKKLYYWSIVPKTDCNITFYSSSKSDTEGLIYDYNSYTYNSNYNEMKKSAICYNDDVGNDLNFKISTTLKAGKRYYLSTKFKLSSRIGSYVVNFNYTCIENHSYVASCLEQDFISGNYDILVLKCVNCSDTQSMLFIDALKQNLSIADVNNDGYVNAKDYAILKKM